MAAASPRTMGPAWGCPYRVGLLHPSGTRACVQVAFWQQRQQQQQHRPQPRHQPQQWQQHTAGSLVQQPVPAAQQLPTSTSNRAPLPQHLNNWIKHATSSNELLELLTEHHQHMDHIHVAAMLVRLAHISTQPPAAAQQQPQPSRPLHTNSRRTNSGPAPGSGGSSSRSFNRLGGQSLPPHAEPANRGRAASSAPWSQAQAPHSSSSSKGGSANHSQDSSSSSQSGCANCSQGSSSTTTSQGSSWQAAALDKQLLDQLTQLLPRHMHHLQARQLSNIMWACCKLAHQLPPALMQQLQQRCQAVGLHSFKPQELSNLLYALALMPPLHKGAGFNSSSRSGVGGSWGGVSLAAEAWAVLPELSSSSGSSSSNSSSTHTVRQAGDADRDRLVGCPSGLTETDGFPCSPLLAKGTGRAPPQHLQQQQQAQRFQARATPVTATITLQAPSSSSSSSSSGHEFRAPVHPPTNNHPPLHMCAAAAAGGAAFLEDLLAAAGTALPACNTHDLCQLIYSLAVADWAPPKGWLAAWLVAADRQLPHFTPQGLANAAYALAVLLQQPGAAAAAAGADLLSPAAESLTRFDREVDRSAAAASGSLEQQEPQEQVAAAARQWLERCLRFASLHLSAFSHQELIGQLLWAAGQLGVAPPASSWPAYVLRTQQLLPGASDQHLSVLLEAQAQLQLQFPGSWWAVYWPALLQALDRGCSTVSLTTVLTAVAWSKLQPPVPVAEALQAAARAAAADLACPVRHRVQLLYGLARWGQPQPQRWLTRYCTVTRHQWEQYKPIDYANTLWALSLLGFEPEHRWVSGLLSASLPALDAFTPQQLSRTAAALAQLKCRPSAAWMEQLLTSFARYLPGCPPQLLSQLAGSLAQLGYEPAEDWMSRFCAAASPGAWQLPAAGILQLVHAVERLGAAPPGWWVREAAAAVLGCTAGAPPELVADGLAAVIALRRRQQLQLQQQQQGLGMGFQQVDVSYALLGLAAAVASSSSRRGQAHPLSPGSVPSVAGGGGGRATPQAMQLPAAAGGQRPAVVKRNRSVWERGLPLYVAAGSSAAWGFNETAVWMVAVGMQDPGEPAEAEVAAQQHMPPAVAHQFELPLPSAGGADSAGTRFPPASVAVPWPCGINAQADLYTNSGGHAPSMSRSSSCNHLPSMSQGMLTASGSRARSIPQGMLGAGEGWMDALLVEAYGISCLTRLMPDWLQQRLTAWPRLWAAARLLPLATVAVVREGLGEQAAAAGFASSSGAIQQGGSAPHAGESVAVPGGR